MERCKNGRKMTNIYDIYRKKQFLWRTRLYVNLAHKTESHCETVRNKTIFKRLFLAILTWKTHWEKGSKICRFNELEDTKATRLPKLEYYRTTKITKLSYYSFQRYRLAGKTEKRMANKAIWASKATKSRQPRLSRPPRLPEVPRLQGHFSKGQKVPLQLHYGEKSLCMSHRK